MALLARLAAGTAIIIIGVAAWRVAVGDARNSSDAHITSGPLPPADIQAAVTALFAAGRCTTAAEAEQGLFESLVALGYGTWRVESEPDVRATDCVSGAILPLERRVLLTRALGPEVNAALVTMSDHTLDNCLGRDDAMRYVRSTLDALGERGYEIRTDGMLAAPADRWEEAKRQFDAGCYVFSGTGRTADGTAVFFLTGD